MSQFQWAHRVYPEIDGIPEFKARRVRVKTMSNKRARTETGLHSSRPGAINVQDAKFTRCSWRRKRRISRQAKVNKLVDGAKNTYMLRCWGVNPYAFANGGYFVVPNTNVTDVAAPGHHLPMVMFDITAAMNWSRVGGSEGLQFGRVVYRPFIRTGAVGGSNPVDFSTSQPQFETPAGAAGGGTANTLFKTPQTFSSLQNGFLRAAFHKYMSAKLLCYGIKNIPVRFRVSLIRFKKNFLAPGFQDADFGGIPGAVATNDNLAQMQALYQYLVGPFRHSPLNDQQPWARKLYQEVKIKDFVIGGAPETASAPYMHQVNIFRQFNTVRKYDWQQNSTFVTDAAWDVNNYDQSSVNNQTNVDFTKRWYLVVRAQALSGTVTAGAPVPDTTRYPSFDFNMINTYEEII